MSVKEFLVGKFLELFPADVIVSDARGKLIGMLLHVIERGLGICIEPRVLSIEARSRGLKVRLKIDVRVVPSLEV